MKNFIRCKIIYDCCHYYTWGGGPFVILGGSGELVYKSQGLCVFPVFRASPNSRIERKMSISFSLVIGGVIANVIQPASRPVAATVLVIVVVLAAIWLVARIVALARWLRGAANIRGAFRPGAFPWAMFVDTVIAFDLWWGHLYMVYWLFDGDLFFTVSTAASDPWETYIRLLSSAILTVQGTGFLLSIPKFWVSELTSALAVKFGQFFRILVLGSVAGAVLRLGG